MTIEDLTHDDSIDLIMDRLYEVFHELQLRGRTHIINKVENLSRNNDESLFEYINRWRRLIRRVELLGITPYDPQVEALKFIQSSRISPAVRSTILMCADQEYNMDKFYTAIKNLYPNRRHEGGGPPSASAKRPPFPLR